MGGRHSNNFLLYVPCFLPGVIAYQLQRVQRRQLSAVVWPGVVIGVVLLYLWSQNLVSSPWTKGWIACLVLGASSPFFAQLSAPWLTEPSRLIAKYSYGIYLTHFFSIWLVFRPAPQCSSARHKTSIVRGAGGSVAHCVYYLLEEPMIRLGKRIAKRFERDTIIANA